MPLPLPHLLLPGMMMTRMRLRTRTLRGLSRLLPRVLFVKVLITLAHLALREITVVVRVVMALVLTLKMMIKGKMFPTEDTYAVSLCRQFFTESR